MIRIDEVESSLTARSTTYMSQYFKIYPEQWSDTKQGRVDYIYTLKGAEDVRFAVECKRPDDKKGGGKKGVGAIITQCMKYSVQTWSGERLPVFLMPSLSGNYLGYINKRINCNTYVDRHRDVDKHHVVNGMLGFMNVGEVRKIRDDKQSKGAYYIFSFNNQEIFSTKKKWMSNEVVGLHRVNYEKLIKSINEWKFL